MLLHLLHWSATLSLGAGVQVGYAAGHRKQSTRSGENSKIIWSPGVVEALLLGVAQAMLAACLSCRLSYTICTRLVSQPA